MRLNRIRDISTAKLIWNKTYNPVPSITYITEPTNWLHGCKYVVLFRPVRDAWVWGHPELVFVGFKPNKWEVLKWGLAIARPHVKTSQVVSKLYESARDGWSSGFCFDIFVVQDTEQCPLRLSNRILNWEALRASSSVSYIWKIGQHNQHVQRQVLLQPNQDSWKHCGRGWYEWKNLIQ